MSSASTRCASATGSALMRWPSAVRRGGKAMLARWGLSGCPCATCVREATLGHTSVKLAGTSAHLPALLAVNGG